MSVSLSLLRKQFSVLKFYAEANCGWYLCFMLYIHKRNWHETYELASFCASTKFPHFYCNVHTNIRWPVSGHYLFGVEITIFCYYSNPMVLSIEKLELCVDSKKIPNKIIIRWKFGRNFNTCKNLFFLVFTSIYKPKAIFWRCINLVVELTPLVRVRLGTHIPKCPQSAHAHKALNCNRIT